MIESIIEYIETIQADRARWGKKIRPWFRGESGDDARLCPKILRYTGEQENYLLQSFRRKAGGLANTPDPERTDMWLFLAQHYGVLTRLLDWTEGALQGLYFAINQCNSNPVVYMLNPHKLNELASGRISDGLNFPLTWNRRCGNIDHAWEERNPDRGLDLPIAVPAIYQDSRMIAQRSCFTVHGKKKEPLLNLLSETKGVEVASCLREYHIDPDPVKQKQLLDDLSILGITGSTIFPDLDHLGKDLSLEIGTPPQHVVPRDLDPQARVTASSTSATPLST